MGIKASLKKILGVGAVSSFILTCSFLMIFYIKTREEDSFSKTNDRKITIFLDDNGITSKTETSSEKVKDFLIEKNIKLKEKDVVIPGLGDSLFAGQRIFIERSKRIKLDVGKGYEEFFTQSNFISDALAEKGVDYSEDDRITPPLQSRIFPDMEIKIVRVLKKTKTVEKEISFQTIIREDPKLDFGKNKTVQEGKNGLKKGDYQIIYENGEEVKRVLLFEEILKEPVPQIVVQGTKITPLSSENGFASWYSGIGAMSAAHRYLPFGSKVKVINKINNKSVIVTINDRGPFISNRVIDLSKDAFSAIASLGSGIVPVIVQKIQ